MALLRSLLTLSTVAVLTVGCAPADFELPELSIDQSVIGQRPPSVSARAAGGGVNQAAFLREAALIAESEQDYAAAARYWAGAHGQSPTPESALRLSRALRAVDRAEDAERIMRAAVRATPGDAALTAELGKALVAAERFDEGAATLIRAAALNPGDVTVLNALGLAADRQGDHAAAQERYAQALALDPNRAAVLNNLGLSQMLNGDLDAAEDTLRRALAAPDAAPHVRQNLAMILGLRGDSDAALRLARQDMSQERAETVVAYYVSVADQPDVWSQAGER